MERTVELGKLITQAKTVRCGNASYPVLSMTMHNGLVFQGEKFKKVIASKDTSDYKVVYRNQLVISFPIDEGVLATQRITDAGIVSPAYGIWDIDQTQILPEYLECALRCNRAIQYYKAKLRGSTARRRSLPTPTLLAFHVPLPSIEKQHEILSQIHRVRSIIRNREEQISKLDDLIKARFVEMFGDPKTNDKGFIKSPMGEYMTLLTDFSSNGSYKTLDSGVTMFDEPNYAWIVRTTDLESGDMSSIKYIDENAYELLSKSKVFGGEIIMNKIGSAGKVYLMPKIDMPASLGRNAFMFRYDDRINVRFLFEQLVSEYGQYEIQQYVRGAVTKTITKDDARAVKIIVPEKELQDEYVKFVTQVDNSKLIVQKSLHETQLLFDKLMQQYFD